MAQLHFEALRTNNCQIHHKQPSC